MIKRFKQWFCVVRAQKPARMVLYIICAINLVILLIVTGIILIIHQIKGNECCFFPQVYNTFLLMIGACSINDLIGQNAIWDIHTVISAIIYILLVIITMLSFTGALIGYLSNKISLYIERSSAGAHPLNLNGHIVILNWNNRAAEIICDMLYKQKRERIVVLVQEGKESIQTEIADRVSDMLRKENPPRHPWYKIRFTKKLRNKLSIVVRQGDIYASERLMDISVGQAKSIIILSPEHMYAKNGNRIGMPKDKEREDCSIVKLLMQVAQIAGDEISRSDQQIIVEVNNKWTMGLIQQIIQQKKKTGKLNIIAVPVNQILGDILAQVIIMPELNLVYNELFSYRGAEFFTKPAQETKEDDFIRKYMDMHTHALPLTVMSNLSVHTGYYIAMREEDIAQHSECISAPYSIELIADYQMEEKSVIILGHNSKSLALIDSLYTFDVEWRGTRTIPVLDITVIDDQNGFKQNDNYAGCSILHNRIEADIRNTETICNEIRRIISSTKQKVSILILSDDTSDCDDADRSVFTHLIYIQSVMNEIAKDHPSYSLDSIDVIVELCDPKNADIIANYSTNYVIISNRYISRVLNHLGEKESLYRFLTDILTYDDINDIETNSKEIYIKRVGDFFKALPAPATARQLILAVYEASPPENKTMVIGYVTVDKTLTLFAGDQNSFDLDLKPDDYLVVFSNH